MRPGFRRNRWKYARANRSPEPLRFWPETRRPRWRRWLGGLRPFVLLLILLALWVTFDPGLVEPPGFLLTDGTKVTARFTRCGPGRGEACVIDGDTFKLGDRKIRIIGIDAPEVHGACPRESELAGQATAGLQMLLNQGPFDMAGRIDEPRDRYGRELMVLTRARPDGSRQSLASEMIDNGLAHRYLGGFKPGWC